MIYCDVFKYTPFRRERHVLNGRPHTHCKILSLKNTHFSSGPMDLKFGTREFLGLLITNPSSKFRNKNWRKKMQSLLDSDDIWYLNLFSFWTWKSETNTHMGSHMGFHVVHYIGIHNRTYKGTSRGVRLRFWWNWNMLKRIKKKEIRVFFYRPKNGLRWWKLPPNFALKQKTEKLRKN